jgi:capsular exopolysaccharide synthesis family protein
MKRATIGKMIALDFMGGEAINAICSNLLFAGRNIKKILLTSVNTSEGKSLITQQMLWNLAKRGKRTVLIDADLRRSNLVMDLEFSTDGPITGLAHFLAGYSTLEDVLYETNIPQAVILPMGRNVKSPVALLALPQFGEMLETLAETFDIVLIDSPPLGVVIDAADIASNCDGTVIVVEHDKTRRKDLVNVRNLIDQTGCPILGCVINKLKLESFGTKRYYNYSGYYCGSHSL